MILNSWSDISGIFVSYLIFALIGTDFFQFQEKMSLKKDLHFILPDIVFFFKGTQDSIAN